MIIRQDAVPDTLPVAHLRRWLVKYGNKLEMLRHGEQIKRLE